jgi:hypothetical protein
MKNIILTPFMFYTKKHFQNITFNVKDKNEKRWARHVARVQEKIYRYRVGVGKTCRQEPICKT